MLLVLSMQSSLDQSCFAGLGSALTSKRTLSALRAVSGDLSIKYQCCVGGLAMVISVCRDF